MTQDPAVSYDPRSFIVRGQRRLLISGEMHYARAPREMWPALLDRSIECGLNTIASYVFWNFHEPQRDRFEFSGDHDLAAFLRLCGERGLMVLLRMGPYCCAEWNYGGYPAWLRDEPGITIRTWNEPYMRRVEMYVRRLCEQVRPCLATHGGPVILCQVENEYANVAKRYGEDGQRYLAWMADLARSLGIDVPIIMCEGGAKGSVDTVNGFSISDEKIAQFRTQHPDLPMVWTELWPGWYDTWGFQNHQRDPRNIATHLLRFVGRGGAGWNYYMWHGGTNFGRNSMYLQTTSYDFGGPLDEHGRVTVKAAYLAKLHRALADHSDLLLAGERASATQPDGTEEIRWQHGGRSLTVHLRPGGARLIGPDGATLFDTEETLGESTRVFSSPAWTALPPLTGWQCSPEPFPARRTDAPTKATQPVEQLRLTHDSTDYCWYSTTLETQEDGTVRLDIPSAGDVLYVYVDEKLVAQSQPPFREGRGPTMPAGDAPVANDLETQIRDGFHHSFTFPANKGRHRLDILAVALGMVKGDWQVAGPMNTERKGIWRPVTANGRPLAGWEMRPGLLGERTAPADGRAPTGTPRPCTWYQTTFSLSADQLAGHTDWHLDMAGLGKGMAFINGHPLGRYWLIAAHGYGADEPWQNKELDGLSLGPAGQPTQRYYRIPRPWLQSRNTLVLFEEQARRPDGVQVEVRMHGT